MQRECRNENVCNSAYRYISNIEIRRSEFNLKTCYSEFFRKRLLQRTWRSLRVFSELFKITCLICRVPVNSCLWIIQRHPSSFFLILLGVFFVWEKHFHLILNLKYCHWKSRSTYFSPKQNTERNELDYKLRTFPDKCYARY